MNAPRYAPLRRALAPALVLGTALFGGAVVGGCDTIDDGEIGRGDFRAVVSGDVDSTFTGDAYWTTVERDGEDYFVLVFYDDDLSANDRDDYAFVALSRAGSTPGVGAFDVSNSDPNPPTFRGQYADLTEADDPNEIEGPVLSATDGVLTITRVNSGLVNGSFRFDARGLRLPSTAAYIPGTVQGSFEARYLNPNVLTNRGLPLGLD